MAANTANLGGFTVFSNLSTAETSGASSYASVFASGDGVAIAPTQTFISDASLGFYKSAASTIALSYGTLTVPNIAFTKLAGSAFTAASSATTRTFADASFEFSVLSLTSNGAQIAFRSGQTIWKFASVAAG